MHDNNSQQTNDWDLCPPGTLASLSTRLVQSRRRGKIFKVTMIVAAVVVAIGAGRLFLQTNEAGPGQAMMYAGISCNDVQAQLPEWKKGQLDESTAARIDEHLKSCDACAAKARALQARRNRAAGKLVAAITSRQ